MHCGTYERSGHGVCWRKYCSPENQSRREAAGRTRERRESRDERVRALFDHRVYLAGGLHVSVATNPLACSSDGRWNYGSVLCCVIVVNCAATVVHARYLGEKWRSIISSC